MKVMSGGRRVWWVACVVALVLMAVISVFFSVPTASPVETEVAAPRAVTLARESDALLTEEAAMRDPTPLFLPTRLNASESAWSPDVRRELLSSFRGYEPKLKYREANLSLMMPPPVPVPEKTAEAFAMYKPVRPYMGLGQRDAAVAPLQARTAFVEVATAGDGQLLIAQPLVDAKPPGEAAWQPMAFLLAIDASGVVGPPVLTESSSVAAVDGYFQDYVLKVLHIGERLAPGFYRVAIGP